MDFCFVRLLRGHYLEVNCDWPFCFCFFFSRTRHLAWRTRKGPSSKSSSRTSPSKSNMDNKVPNRLEGSACSPMFLHHWNVLFASLPYSLSCYFLSDYTAVKISHFEETKDKKKTNVYWRTRRFYPPGCVVHIRLCLLRYVHLIIRLI